MGCGGWTGVLHRHPFKWEPATRGAVSWESPDAAPSRSTLVFRPRPYRKCPSGSGVGARLWPFLLKVDYLGNLGPKLRTGLRLSPHCSVVWGFFLPSLPPPRPSSPPPILLLGPPPGGTGAKPAPWSSVFPCLLLLPPLPCVFHKPHPQWVPCTSNTIFINCASWTQTVLARLLWWNLRYFMYI